MTQGDTIVEVPPIIRYAKGRSMTWFIGYAMQRGWSVYSIL